MSKVTSKRYSHVARCLHWVSAIVILWATVSGIYAAAWAAPQAAALLSFVNISLTTLLIPIFLLRVAYRLVVRPPGPLNLSRNELRAAQLGHFLLYASTAVVLVSGVLMMDRDIAVFDWLSIRRPVYDERINRFFASVHAVGSSLLGLLILIHIAAVVRHERRGIPVLRRMLWSRPRPRDPVSPNGRPGTRAGASARDASGQVLFSHGEIGAAHVLAHRLLDEGRVALGHRLLGRWLEGRRGSGSDWVHIHFHLALFELALGEWDAAYGRFLDEILPAAEATEDALTDAPALLWRLQLAAPEDAKLPWEPLRRTALERMNRPSEPFVELHHLLALAGAGDRDSIERWVRLHPPCEDTSRECVLRRLAIALGAYASRAYRQAAEAVDSLLPLVQRLGGSLEQNRIFLELARPRVR